MADRDDDTRSNRGFASMDKETREAIARKGGEASHKNDDRSSSSGSAGGERGGSSGSREGGSSGGRGREPRGGERGGSSGGGRGGGREGQGVWYDEEAGQCRDDSGQFVECPPGMEGKGTRNDPNREHVSSKGGEHSRGHGGSSGSSSSGGRGRSESSGSSSSSRSGRD